MTREQYEKLPAEDLEHFMQCPRCGEMFDKRSLDEVVFHIHPRGRTSIRYSGSQKLKT